MSLSLWADAPSHVEIFHATCTWIHIAEHTIDVQSFIPSLKHLNYDKYYFVVINLIKVHAELFG